MKYIKLYESYNSIEEICQKYNIKNYTINSDGSIDVNGDVDLKGIKFFEDSPSVRAIRLSSKLNNWTLKEIPIKFRNISGSFDIRYNEITSLENGPERVGDKYYISNNKIQSLNGCPKEVGRFLGGHNEYSTLEGGPDICRGDYNVSSCNLISLKGVASKIHGYLGFGSNKIYTLDHFPTLVDKIRPIAFISGIEQNIFMEDTPIKNLCDIFLDPLVIKSNSIKKSSLENFFQSLDYGYLRNNIIIERRFALACEEFGITNPSSIDGYEFR